jgi:hypothetical protein
MRKASGLAPFFQVVSAPLRISSTHFSAPLLRDVTTEVINQLKKRENLPAICPLSIVDFDAHCEVRGLVGPPSSTIIMVLDNSSASFVRISSDSFSLVNTSTNGIIPFLIGLKSRETDWSHVFDSRLFSLVDRLSAFRLCLHAF